MKPTEHDRRSLQESLGAYRPADEEQALERSLQTVLSAFEQRGEPATRRRSALRAALALIGALLVAGLALSPAGASVREWVAEAIDPGADTQQLERLPTPGKLLVDSGRSVWVVSEDGSRRRLGSYSAAAWSPNVIFVALADGRQLAVAEPDGKLRWSITAPAKVADLAWAAPSGFRIAYRAGRELRVVEGTGTGDRSVADAVAAVGPAWRPGAADDSGPYELAFVGRDRRVRLADADDPTAEPMLGPSSVGASHLLWLDADRLAAIDRGRIVILDSRLRPTRRIPLPGGGEVTAADVAPGAGRIALARSEGSYPPSSELLLIRVGRNIDEVRSVFSIPGEYAGLSFSPDERWIAAGWPQGDSWLLAKRRANLKTLDLVKVYGGLQRQFDPGGNAPGPSFPRILGWG